MSTTTIRLDDELKARLAAAAERVGTSAHAFILDIIKQSVEEAELEEELSRIADRRWAKLIETGKTVPWDDAKRYITARARGAHPPKPAARRPKRP